MDEPDDQESDDKPWDWRLPAAVGALAIHFIVGIVGFVLGCLSGAKPTFPDGAPAATGVMGGLNVLIALFMVYVFTFGIVPLVLSSIGAFAAVWFSALKNDPSG